MARSVRLAPRCSGEMWVLGRERDRRRRHWTESVYMSRVSFVAASGPGRFGLCGFAVGVCATRVRGFLAKSPRRDSGRPRADLTQDPVRRGMRESEKVPDRCRSPLRPCADSRRRQVRGLIELRPPDLAAAGRIALPVNRQAVPGMLRYAGLNRCATYGRGDGAIPRSMGGTGQAHCIRASHGGPSVALRDNFREPLSRRCGEHGIAPNSKSADLLTAILRGNRRPPGPARRRSFENIDIAAPAIDPRGRRRTHAPLSPCAPNPRRDYPRTRQAEM